MSKSKFPSTQDPKEWVKAYWADEAAGGVITVGGLEEWFRAAMDLAGKMAYHQAYADGRKDGQASPDEARTGDPVPQSFDARDWAKEFVRIFNGCPVRDFPPDCEGSVVDTGTMIAWFSNALMRGFDEHASRTRQDHDARPTGIEAAVCEDVAARQRKGVKKYGTTVAENPLGLSEWLRHQYEELLDAAIYCRRAIEEVRAPAVCPDKGPPQPSAQEPNAPEMPAPMSGGMSGRLEGGFKCPICGSPYWGTSEFAPHPATGHCHGRSHTGESCGFWWLRSKERDLSLGIGTELASTPYAQPGSCAPGGEKQPGGCAPELFVEDCRNAPGKKSNVYYMPDIIARIAALEKQPAPNPCWPPERLRQLQSRLEAVEYRTIGTDMSGLKGRLLDLEQQVSKFLELRPDNTRWRILPGGQVERVETVPANLLSDLKSRVVNDHIDWVQKLKMVNARLETLEKKSGGDWSKRLSDLEGGCRAYDGSLSFHDKRIEALESEFPRVAELEKELEKRDEWILELGTRVHDVEQGAHAMGHRVKDLEPTNDEQGWYEKQITDLGQRLATLEEMHKETK